MTRFLRGMLLVVLLSGVFPVALSAAEGSISAKSIEKMGRESGRMLQDLIRIDTVNPPGNESRVADYLEKVCRREKIPYERLAREKGRDNFIARIKGSGDGEPILLYSHSDVVPAEEGDGRWIVDPFDGEVKDGFLYGRGAIDAKGLLVSHLAVMILLRRNEIQLDRDVIFLAAAAEETGGWQGVTWLLDKYPDRIAAEVALGEGGRVWMRADSVWSLWVQAGERSAHNLTVTAIGESGHAAVPSEDNPIDKLVRALNRMSEVEFPEKDTRIADTFFSILGPYDPRLVRAGGRYDAMTRTTFTVTLIEGGVKTNVIPSVATANLNARLMPGDDLDEVVAALQNAAGEPGVTVEHKPGVENKASVVKFQTPFFDSIDRAAKRQWPNAVVVPYLSPGTSDASKLRAAGILAYGLMPFPVTEEDNEGVHGANERVALASLTEGIRFSLQILEEWAGHGTPILR